MQKRIYVCMNLAIVVTGAYTFFWSGIDRFVLGAVSLLFLLIPPVAERLFRFRLGYPLKTGVLFFSFLGFNLGTALRWFDIYLGFDKFTHGLAGILFTVTGMCMYVRMGGFADRRRQKLLQISFAVFFSMTIAVVWEIGEFAGYLLTGHDSQHHVDTGVFDTMGDIIACAVGSLVAAWDYWVYTQRGKSLFMPMVLAFDRANQ